MFKWDKIKLYISIYLIAYYKSVIIFLHLVIFKFVVLVLFSSTSSLYFNINKKYLLIILVVFVIYFVHT